MKASPEELRVLDARIAAEVMGWQFIIGSAIDKLPASDPVPELHGITPEGVGRDVPLYSSSWEGMRLVVERLHERGYEWVFESTFSKSGWGWLAQVYADCVLQAWRHAPTLTEAVALAALAALAPTGERVVPHPSDQHRETP